MTTGLARIFASALLLLAANAAAAAAVALSTPPPEDCVTDLVAFSPCFGYVSAQPNRVRRRLSPKCCNVVLESFGTGGSNCYCHLVKQPLLFGFPLNRTRIASLPALCSRRHANASSAAVISIDSSLKTICAALPPVPSSHSSSGAPRPSDSGYDNDSSAAMSPPTESAQAPLVSVPHNVTHPPAAPPAPPMTPPPPAQSGNHSPPSSTAAASHPPVLDTDYSTEPDCSMAAELGSIKTWVLQVAAALAFLLSALI